jgi:N-acetylglucosamine malate deacetylase 1
MNPYHQLVSEYARFAREGRDYPLGKFARCPRPQVAHDAPRVLLFSPHPDDEVITGALPLRLLRQAKWRVINVAVTLGSRAERQSERLTELKACCDCIGFELVQTAPKGLDKINLTARRDEPAIWAQSVKVIADLLTSHRPRVIVLPHAADWHPTHIGTHHLVLDALASLPAGFACSVVETEFWRPMESPNLMIEVGLQDLGDLLTALSFHVGEVKRNPYHLSLPAWMMDNVRRGGEWLAGAGAAPPDFPFATLYRIARWSDGELKGVCDGGKVLNARENPARLFED